MERWLEVTGTAEHEQIELKGVLDEIVGPLLLTVETNNKAAHDAKLLTILSELRKKHSNSVLRESIYEIADTIEKEMSIEVDDETEETEPVNN